MTPDGEMHGCRLRPSDMPPARGNVEPIPSLQPTRQAEARRFALVGHVCRHGLPDRQGIEGVLPNRVLFASLDLDDKDLLQIIMPPEGLTVVWCQIDLDINGRVEKLRERLGEYLKLGGGSFSIPHEQGMTAAIIRLRLRPGQAYRFMNKASIADDPEQRAPILHHGSDIGLCKLVCVACGPVRHSIRGTREGAVEELMHWDRIQKLLKYVHPYLPGDRCDQREGAGSARVPQTFRQPPPPRSLAVPLTSPIIAALS
jgi:hypothetical protein